MGVWEQALNDGEYGQGANPNLRDSTHRDDIIGLGWMLNNMESGLVRHSIRHPFSHSECQFDLWTGLVNMIQFSSAHGHTGVAVYPTAHMAQNAWNQIMSFIGRDIHAMTHARAELNRIEFDATVLTFAREVCPDDEFEADHERVFAVLVAAGRLYTRMHIEAIDSATQRDWEVAIGGTLQGLQENLDMEMPDNRRGTCGVCGQDFPAGAMAHVGSTGVSHRITRQ